MSGCFITLEGGEGAGKSTQLALLKQAFDKAGLPAITTREPGGTTGAESIRKLLVEGTEDQWDPTTETILFMAARIDHVRKKILPATREGTHVLCDRFADSTAVYQGLGKGLGLPFIEMLHHFTLGNMEPDLTLIFDIEPEKGLARTKGRDHEENRFENMELAFHRRVREGFLTLAKANPKRCVVIDASKDADDVHQQVLQAVQERLGLKL